MRHKRTKEPKGDFVEVSSQNKGKKSYFLLGNYIIL